MHDPLTAWRSLSANFSRPCRPQTRQWATIYRRVMVSVPSLLLGLVVSFSGATRVQAASPDTAPTALTQTLAEIDAAANRRDLQAVMGFYARNFTHSDGLTYSNLEQALRALWQRYPNLTYRTELTNWEASEDGYVVETTTTINGTEDTGGRELTLTATIGSRQRFEGQTIVNQEILAERSQLSTGENPPVVDVNLPDTVAIGRDFAFDAIVQEPLGERLLLGTAIEETINANTYLNSPPIDLELLSAGGLFKVGRAPAIADDRWISAVLVREDGITAVTQRLRVTGRSQ
jgi:hypothetical protein